MKMRSIVIVGLSTLVIAVGFGVGSQTKFSVRLSGFYGNPLYPLTRETISSRSYDISSLVAKQRDTIVKVLRRATASTATSVRDIRLLVNDGSDEWAVSASGNVEHGREKLTLSPNDFKELKRAIYESMPPPEEVLAWRKVDSGS